jgi:hypothetical protein
MPSDSPIKKGPRAMPADLGVHEMKNPARGFPGGACVFDPVIFVKKRGKVNKTEATTNFCRSFNLSRKRRLLKSRAYIVADLQILDRL